MIYDLLQSTNYYHSGCVHTQHATYVFTCLFDPCFNIMHLIKMFDQFLDSIFPARHWFALVHLLLAAQFTSVGRCMNHFNASCRKCIFVRGNLEDLFLSVPFNAVVGPFT